MPDKVSLLHRLAAISVAAAGSERLVEVADILRAGLDVEHVCLIYPGAKDLAVCGDSGWDGEMITSQTGLWLLAREIERAGGPVAFDIEGKRVTHVADATQAGDCSYLAFPAPGNEDSGEMLIARRKPGAGMPYGPVRDFLEAAGPSMELILNHALAAERVAKQKEQIIALANAGELLTRAENIEPVLQDLATTIADSSGFDWVTIDVYDTRVSTFGARVLNRRPHADTLLGRYWKQQAAQRTYPKTILRAAMEEREPLLFGDLQADERIPEYGREFFRRAGIRSAAQLPITFGDRFLGVLRVASLWPRSFHSREMEVLNGFAMQLAVALGALDMYKSLAESEKQLKRYADELQESMRVQHRLARTDALTGIPNRRYIDEVMKGECSRAARYGAPLSVVLLDVDFFKHVNDTYGHKAGDEALIQLADVARRACRRSDTVGRYGGDEFVFVLSKAGLGAAVMLAERLRDEVANRIFALSANINVTMTASAGVTELFSEGKEKPSALIRRADQALYEAKAKGRNTVVSIGAIKRAA